MLHRSMNTEKKIELSRPKINEALLIALIIGQSIEMADQEQFRFDLSQPVHSQPIIQDLQDRQQDVLVQLVQFPKRNLSFYL
jgi:hypothetical protein